MHGRLTRLANLDVARTRAEPVPRLRPRGLPPALAAHCVWVAATPEDAAAHAVELLGGHRVRVGGDDRAAFEASYHAVLVRDITLGYLDYGTAVTVRVPRLRDDHLLLVPATGAARVRCDGLTVNATPTKAVVPRADRPLAITTNPNTALLVVRIARPALEVHLSRLIGRTLQGPIRFDVPFELSRGTANRWNLAVQMLLAELHDPDSLLHERVGLGQLEEFVMSSLLYAHSSNYTDALTSAHRPARRAVRSARRFIDEHLADAISVSDIAAAGGVGIRTLQSQFAADLGQSPTAYLRDRRLDRVHAALADAPADGSTTVTDIASRWGFTHLGRFSAVYRARFGEPPSRTLHS